MATTIEATAAAALAPETLRRLEGAPLAEFLRRQRWFAGKQEVENPRFAEIVTLFPTCDAVFTQVDVGSGPATASYLVPMAVTDKPVDPDVVIATVRTGATSLSIVDAPHFPGFREALLKYLLDGRSFGGDGVQLRFTRHQTIDIDPYVGSRVAPHEQSNTSILYGDALILKLFRKLTVGVNPDVEIGGYLTRKRARFVPQLVGSATLEGAPGPKALLMMQRLVPGAIDLWSYVVGQIPQLLYGGEPFIDEARNLGSITRELHETLAAATDRDFAPRPATHNDLVRWCATIRREIDESLALLARTKTDALCHEGADIKRIDALLREVTALETAPELELGLMIRHHGDYHLGQVLRDPGGGLYVIDFEGEPTRDLTERRALHSPLRDVAGMLRSFAYASAQAGASQAPGGPARGAALERASAWQTRLRQAFLESYLAVTSPTVPIDPAASGRLLRLFEIEKTFYELRYELAHRPDWVWVPMRGVSDLVRESPSIEKGCDRTHSASA